MIIKRGDIFKSSKLMDDPNFIDVNIIIVSNDISGSVGFVFNKIFTRTLNELIEFRTMQPFPLYVGGPVDQEHIYMIYEGNDIIKDGTHIAGNLYLGGAFNMATSGIQQGNITTKNIKLFLGYCGWNADELENEIDEGSWEKTGFDLLNIFD